MAQFRPLYDRVLIKRIEAQDRTAGGLFLPESAKEKPQQAVVVAVGTGRITKSNEVIPLIVKEGDQVIFGKYSGETIELDGEEHLILRESDILAIVG